jgi:predicted ATPase/DNA-binding SARP family transcriptional activator
MLPLETAASGDVRLSPLTIRLFGPFEVRLRGQPLPRLRSRKGQWLLALLALRHGHEVERAWLAGTLWPDSAEAAAYASLRKSLKDLRRALGAEAGRLRSPSPRTLALDLEEAEADVVAFDHALAQGEEPAWERAVALYRGPLLEEWAEEWVLPERQAREEACLTALETLAALALARGDPAAAETCLRRAVVLDPLRETAQRVLMQTLASRGSDAAMIQVYRDLCLRLHRELNAEPDPETQALFQQLRAEARDKAALGSANERQRGEHARWTLGSRCRAARDESTRGEAAPPTQRPAPSAQRGSAATLTFLLTDIEDSTKLWLQDPEAMRIALARHDALAVAIIQEHEGRLVQQRGEGYSLFAAFPRSSDAVAAALEFQRALLDCRLSDKGIDEGRPSVDVVVDPQSAIPSSPLKVRVALHTGEAELREGDYFGLTVDHGARLRAVGHGGQILLSPTTAALARDELPAGTSLRELGAHRLKDLQRPEPIFQLAHLELPQEFPPLRSLEAFTHNLPVQLTRFIGREGAISAVKRLLTATHLLTLTGAGGCGKTRLAQQVAAELVEQYRDGIWLVELAPLSDPALVPQTVASTLGVLEEPGRPLFETLADALRPRSLLLVLDNCEHLLPACAQLADRLLRACPDLRILATSREPLRLLGEQAYRVPSLAVPDPGPLPSPERLQEFEAVGLFVDRALLSQPAFALTGTNARAVVEVCQRLDGIPLAIELAAARVRALPVEKISERLDDMFRLLTGGSRAALPRQQTLRALVDWSYDLLTGPERSLLRRLSVFAGGWTLEAAEAVGAGDGLEAEEVIDLLSSLVEKSLVGYEEGAPRTSESPVSEPRYRLLETVRQYAHGRLVEAGETASARARHRDWFLALAEQAEPELLRSDQLVWLDRLETEHDNLRAALEWCRTEAAGAGPAPGEPSDDADPIGWRELRLAGALVWFWVHRSYLSEGRQCLEAALSRGSRAPARLRTRVLLGAGWLTHATFIDPATTVRFYQAGLELARATRDPEGMALGLAGLAVHSAISHETEQAIALAEESLVRAREAGDPWLIGRCLHVLGLAVCNGGEGERAISLFQESLALLRPVGERGNMSYALVNLGAAAQARGDYEAARGAYREALICNHELRNRVGMAMVLECLAEVAVAENRPEQGARLMAAAEGLLDTTGAFWSPSYVASRERTRTTLCAALGEAAAAAAQSEGRGMPLEQAIFYALMEPLPEA